jgi:hypothetical protein
MRAQRSQANPSPLPCADQRGSAVSKSSDASGVSAGAAQRPPTGVDPFVLDSHDTVKETAMNATPSHCDDHDSMTSVWLMIGSIVSCLAVMIAAIVWAAAGMPVVGIA